MTRVSSRHPRYYALQTRGRLVTGWREGLVVPEGLIAQGRAEAFDYFLGERTTRSAARAERIAAQWLATARHPVLSVNGNVAALAATEVARLSWQLPKLAVEVNLFHRTRGRASAIAKRLDRAGVRRVLGLRPNARLPGLPSDRGRIDARGIARADVCLVPLEDGDRTAALRRLGKRVISIDLNPLARTSLDADLPIVDELGRALRNIRRSLPLAARRRVSSPVSRKVAEGLLADALRTMERRLKEAAKGPTQSGPARQARVERRPFQETVRRRRRTR